MPELPDDLTDALFQSGAERHDFTYDPAAWQQMEVLLDDHRAARRRRTLAYVAAALFVSALLVGLLYLNADGTPELVAPPAVIATTQAGSSDEGSAGGLSPKPEATELSAESSAVSTTAAVERLSPKPARLTTSVPSVTSLSPGSHPAQTNSFFKAHAQALEATNRVNTSRYGGRGVGSGTTYADNVTSRRDQAQANRPHAEQPSHLDATVPTEATRAATTSLSDAPSLGESNALGSDRRANETPALTADAETSLAVLAQSDALRLASLGHARPLALPTVPEVGPTPSLNDSPFAPRLSVRGYAGILLGATSGSGSSGAHGRAGVGLVYRFAERFSASTGVGINELHYATVGEDYTISEEGWFGGATPNAISAECRMVEVPLELTYHFAPAGSSGAYARAGLTSFFVLREDYDYAYDEDNLPAGVEMTALRTSYGERGGNRHLFASAQFTAGYSFRRSGRTALQLEGFAGIPLTGVGHGAVSVWTFGLTGAVSLDVLKPR